MSSAGVIAHCLSPGQVWFAGPVALNGISGGSQDYYKKTEDITDWSGAPIALPLGRTQLDRMSVVKRALFMTFTAADAVVSFDYGETFEACDSPLTDQDVYHNGTYFVCGSELSVDGLTWTTIPNLPGTPTCTIARNTDGAIIIVYDNAGDTTFGYTLNNGTSWTSVVAIYPGEQVTTLITNGTRINFTIGSPSSASIVEHYTDDFFVTQEDGGGTFSGTYYGQYGCNTLLQNEFSSRLVVSWDGGFSWSTSLSSITTESNYHHMQFGDNLWAVLIRTAVGSPNTNELATSADGARTWDRNVATLYGNVRNIAYVGARGSCDFYASPEYVLFTGLDVLAGTPEVAEVIGYRNWSGRIPAVSPDAQYLYTNTNTDPAIQVYKKASNGFGYNLLPGAIPYDSLEDYAVSYTGEYVALCRTAGDGYGIMVLRKSGDVWTPLVVPGANDTVRTCVAFSPRSNILIVGHGTSSAAYVYTISGDTISGPYTAATGNTPMEFSFAHDHDWVTIDTNVGTYRIFDLSDPTTPVQMASNNDYTSSPTGRYFSADDSHIISPVGVAFDPALIVSQSFDGISTIGASVTLGTTNYRVLASAKSNNGLYIAVTGDQNAPYLRIFGLNAAGTAVTYSRDYGLSEVPNQNGSTPPVWVGV